MKETTQVYHHHAAPRPRPWKFTAAVIATISSMWFAATAEAQLLDDNPWPEDPVDVFLGWDFSEMTVESQAAFEGIMNPLTDEEIEKTLTPDQLQSRQHAIFAITRPEEYAKVHPIQRTPAEQARMEFQKWVISHPIEAGQLANRQKTPEQLQQDALSLWMMTHPKEAFGLTQRFTTPEQIKAQALAIMEASNPDINPKPVGRTVPFTQAPSAVNEAKAKN
jgi:hypothetical protein